MRLARAMKEECPQALATYAYMDSGPDNYSWIHKGSSGRFPTYPGLREGDKGAEHAPAADADLMKYYLEQPEDNITKATEYDVRSLIWLSRISFGL